MKILSLFSNSLAGCLLIASTMLPNAVHGQQVIPVDSTGANGALVSLQAAVDAAADGDLILVKDGSYGSILVDSKSIRIAADSNQDAVNILSIKISNIAAGQTVEVHGLKQSGLLFGVLVWIENCAGAVLIQNCDFSLGAAPLLLSNNVYVSGCSAVTVVNTTVDSRTDEPLPFPAFAINCINSNLYLYNCDLFAGLGAAGVAFESTFGGGRIMPGAEGPAAIRLAGGNLVASGCLISGGRGGSAGIHPLTDFCTDAGDGGPAIQLLPGMVPPSATLVGCETLVGEGGFSGGLCAEGLPGAEIVKGQSGSFSEPPLFARSLSQTPVVRSGETMTLEYAGEAFDLVWLMHSVQPAAPLYSSLISGAVYPGIPFNIRFQGLLNGEGQKVLALPLSDSGFEFLPLYSQVLFFNATEEFTVSNPTFCSLLSNTQP